MTGVNPRARLRINILMGPFYPVPPVRGGAVERVQSALALEYANQGHQVTMVSRRFVGMADDEIVDGVRHIRVASWDEPKSSLVYRVMDMAYVSRAIRVLPEADVTVTNTVSAPLLLPLSKAGIIYVNVGRFPKRQMGLYRRAARLQAVSEAVATAIRSQTPLMADRVRVIGNPLGHEFAAAAENVSPIRARNREVLYLGRIAREKGVHHLLSAFGQLASRFPDWSLRIVGPWNAAGGGDGEAYIQELRSAAAPLGGRVHFEGPVYDVADIIERLRLTEIFAYPSIAEEGESFGLAPLEAMACGCAVIVSDLACFAEFIRPGDNGLSFERRDDPVRGLADCMFQLMSSQTMRRDFGLNAMTTATEFSPKRISHLMTEDFLSLLDSNPN